MIKGIAERLDPAVQNLNVTGVAKNSPASPPASGKPVEQAKNGIGDAQAQQPGADAAQPQISQDTMDRLNKQLQALNPKVSISVDQEANRYILRYKDPNSGEVIQQMPPEGVLEMVRKLSSQKGLMVNSTG
ncbi:MAG: flagellar protein FlaG [Nitrospinae bacterium]|nr:flagellar protein FlaG [Nitrospinota bacterium]